MKIGIVGWGLEAQSAFRYFGPEHEYLIVNESRQDNFPLQTDRIQVRFLAAEAPVGIGGQVADLSYLEGIKNCDKIVYQPTSYFNLKKAFGDDSEFWNKAATAYDIFFENSTSKKIIGVTGTKGKGTTSTLIAKMLKAAGETVHLGGNIGTPILDMLPNIKPEDWIVWELANFQLKPASYSPHIAVCLMISPEHLDWHPDVQDYIEAKGNLFRHQKPDDIAIYSEDNEHSKYIAGFSPGIKIPYFYKPGAFVRADRKIVIGEEEVEIIGLSDIKLLGEHNWQNICAALTAVWQVSQDVEAFRKVLSSFGGLEHRLELVRELNGVKYYDDSFGTHPDTAAVALRAIIEPVVLILGGHDKGLDYTDLIQEITGQEKVRHIITIGEIGPKLAKMLLDRDFKSITEGLQTMPEIVADAKAHAQPGDAVLLSCGTSSFGMFKDYKDRGDKFKAAVRALS
jgi:UDP-N-acetylmuramoylalanine--D-glutamate ligase